MNRTVLHGRMTKDPDTKFGNTAVTHFNVAVDRKFKRDGEPTADFINCVAFGKIAETIDKWFKKGSEIVVSGRIQTGSYKNQNGQTIYTTDVVVEDFDFCGNKGQSNSELPSSSQDDFRDIPKSIEEDLPFNKPGARYDDKPVQQSIDDLPFART